MMAALSVVILLLGAVLEVLDLTAVILASIFLMIALASAEPIQIGSAFLLSISCKTTIGEPVLVSNAIPITFISIIAIL